MKKYIKLSVLLLSIVLVFVIHNALKKKSEKYIYIPLGDSIAEGMDAYFVVDYGYPDYIKDYLDKNNRLSFYTKKFSKSGYETKDVKNDIENNKVVEVDGKKIYLKEILRESDLVTLTIGANDFIHIINFKDIEGSLNVESAKKKADEIAKRIEELIILIKQYAKKQIIVTGYFNPYPRNIEYKETITELVKYFNNLIEEVCEEQEVNYVDIYDLISNEKALPNPGNIHPSKYGYELIANKIIKSIE